MTQNQQPYLDLIQQLLSSPWGEATDILQLHPVLMDENLVKVALTAAENATNQGEEYVAQFLVNVAQQVAGAIGMDLSEMAKTSEPADPRKAAMLLEELLQTERQRLKQQGSQQIIFAVLQRHLGTLNLGFIPVMQQVIRGKIAENPDSAESIVALIENISIHISNFPLGHRAENLEITIAGYQLVLDVRTQDGNATGWAQTMNNLAAAYYSRIRGDRADNIETAIAAYQQALTVRTQTAMPVEWARTMMNLANAYYSRIRGDRAENIETAIAAYQQALTVRTQTAMPVEWAQTMMNLAIAYKNRIRGDRAENIETAIAAYQQALTVRTQTAMPVEWAETMNNLAAAYYSRIRGDRAENIETAIAAYQQALTVRTQTAMPVEWAETMNNLAAAYYSRIRGDRAENIETAIAAYQQALTVRTQTAMPVEWAQTMMNLATAYYSRIRGDRAENIETAIAAYQQALTVRTQTAMPVEWAQTMMNLATAYYSRIRGDRADNIETAIAAYREALTLHTPENFPLDALGTGGNLGNLGFTEGRWDIAIEGYQIAIAGVEQSRHWAVSDQRKQEILEESLEVYEKTIHAAIQLGRLDLALQTVERSRSKRLAELMATPDLYTDGTVPDDIRPILDGLQTIDNQLDQHRQPGNSSPDRTLTGATRQSRAALKAENEQIQQLEAQRRDYLDQLYAKDPVSAGLNTVQIPDIDHLQTLLPNTQTALLSFYTTDTDTHIFILKSDSLHHFICKDQGFNTLQSWLIDAWVNPYIRIAQGKNREERNQHHQQWQQAIPNVLAELSQRLQITNLLQQDYMTNVQELILIPHLFLHQIPFAALPLTPSPSASANPVGVFQTSQKQEELPLPKSLSQNSKGTSLWSLFSRFGRRGWGMRAKPSETPTSLAPSEQEAPEEPGYLGDRYQIRYAPSCQILDYCHQREAVPLAALGTVENATHDLPFSSYEGEQIAQLFGVRPGDRLQGQNATPQHYRDLLSRVQSLLSSHHAQSRIDNPIESALILANHSRITLGQLLSPGWRFKNLGEIFLSCCETGLSFSVKSGEDGLGVKRTDDIFTLGTGCVKRTDDIFTLGTGFLCAGARAVISTLWSVDDLATCLFSIFYHRHRKQGSDRVIALQQAQADLRTLSGSDLKQHYAPRIREILDQQQEAIVDESYEQREILKRLDQNDPRHADLSQQIEQLTTQSDRIQDGLNWLKYCCTQPQPFDHPIYWSAFVVQGMR